MIDLKTGRAAGVIVTVGMSLLIGHAASAEQTATPYAFDNGSSPDPFPYTDWDYGEFKAQCSSGGPVVGLSAATTGRAHSVLCKSPIANGDAYPFYSDTSTVETFLSSNSTHYGSHGDWDNGYYKGECSSTEFVVGTAQTTGGAFGRFICGGITTTDGLRPSNTCHTVAFPGNNPNSFPDGDWAYGYYKLACNPGEVTVGMSADPSTHNPHAILCCALHVTIG